MPLGLLDRLFWAAARLFPRAPATGLDGPRGAGRIGGAFVEGLPGATRLPDGGLLAGTGALGHGDLDAGIDAFYLRTAALRLDLQVRWTPPFALGARAFAALYPRRWGQLELPASDAADLTNEVWSAGGSRWWVRRYRGTDRALYVCEYAVARVAAEPDPCLRLTFPVPGGAWCVVLRTTSRGAALVLTEDGGIPGGAGLYLVPSDGPPRYVRALREEIVLSPVGAGVDAVHTFRWWGLRILELRYAIRDQIARAQSADGHATPRR